MPTGCNSCEDFTCTEAVPTCASLLNIGFPIDTLSNTVSVFAQKLLGGEPFVQVVDIDGYTDGISLDITDSYFNEFDGIYLIWATDSGSDVEPKDRLTLELDGVGQYTLYGVEFVRTRGKTFNEITIVPIT